MCACASASRASAAASPVNTGDSSTSADGTLCELEQPGCSAPAVGSQPHASRATSSSWTAGSAAPALPLALAAAASVAATARLARAAASLPRPSDSLKQAACGEEGRGAMKHMPGCGQGRGMGHHSVQVLAGRAAPGPAGGTCFRASPTRWSRSGGGPCRRSSCPISASTAGETGGRPGVGTGVTGGHRRCPESPSKPSRCTAHAPAPKFSPADTNSEAACCTMPATADASTSPCQRRSSAPVAVKDLRATSMHCDQGVSTCSKNAPGLRNANDSASTPQQGPPATHQLRRLEALGVAPLSQRRPSGHTLRQQLHLGYHKGLGRRGRLRVRGSSCRSACQASNLGLGSEGRGRAGDGWSGGKHVQRQTQRWERPNNHTNGTAPWSARCPAGCAPIGRRRPRLQPAPGSACRHRGPWSCTAAQT